MTDQLYSLSSISECAKKIYVKSKLYFTLEEKITVCLYNLKEMYEKKAC